MKILALQFKYFGDAVLLTPALRALRDHFSGSEIHLLVPAEIAPLFQHLPWLTRVWAMPRQRGRARISETWPFIRALRAERFDRSVDFAGNDRGAVISRLIAAPRRLGRADNGGFWGRKFCYTERVAPPAHPPHAAQVAAQILTAWNVPPPASLAPEIHVDPVLEKARPVTVPAGAVLCHITTSNDKKQWPVAHWARLHEMARADGIQILFSAGPAAREQHALAALQKLCPTAAQLPSGLELPVFLLWLKQFRVFISGDTGPLHFAAGLGVPTIGLFGPSSAAQWAPAGKNSSTLQAARCTCDGLVETCNSATHCLATVTPEQVLAELKKILAVRTR
jgi:ADP-heptose:LPS heptosyltransferase